MCFTKDSSWNGQGVRQNCISGIDRLIYQHIVYSDNIWCAFHKVVVLVLSFTLFATLFLSRLISSKRCQNCHNNLSYQLFASVQCVKVPCIFHWSVYHPCKGRVLPFLWPNANSICGHKLIEQIKPPFFFFFLVLERFQHWYINLFLGWLWPPLHCADRITGNSWWHK